jgi:hypothetical protein
MTPGERIEHHVSEEAMERIAKGHACVPPGSLNGLSSRDRRRQLPRP